MCFNCGSKFVPGHKCNPTLFLYLVVDQENSETLEGDPPPEPDAMVLDGCADEVWQQDIPSILFHALMGHMVPSTLKLAGSINGQEVLILVDGVLQIISFNLALHRT